MALLNKISPASPVRASFCCLRLQFVPAWQTSLCLHMCRFVLLMLACASSQTGLLWACLNECLLANKMLHSMLTRRSPLKLQIDLSSWLLLKQVDWSSTCHIDNIMQTLYYPCLYYPYTSVERKRMFRTKQFWLPLTSIIVWLKTLSHFSKYVLCSTQERKLFCVKYLKVFCLFFSHKMLLNQMLVANCTMAFSEMQNRFKIK